MDQGGDAAEEADREAHLPEHIPLPSRSESRPCTFNHEVGINVFEISDSIDMCASTPGAVRMGVAYVQVRVEKKSDCSSPSFRTRLQAFVCDWSRRAGWPRLVRYDRRTHDRDVFSSIPIENGVMIRPAGLEMPEQIRRVGRRGDMSKKMTSKATNDMHVSGREPKDMILGECFVKLPSKGMQILRSVGSRRTSQTCCNDKGYAPVVGSHQVDGIALVLQKITSRSRRTRIEMEWQIKIRSFSRRTKTASAKRNYATPYSSAMPLIVYVRVRPQNYRYSTTHKPKVLHFSQQRLRHHEVSSKSVLHLRNHRELLTMIETMKMSETNTNDECRKSERWMKQQKSYGHLHP